MTAVTVTFDGTALTSSVSSAVILDGLRRPGSGENRDVRVSVPGRDGNWLFAGNPGDGEITVPVKVTSQQGAARTAARGVAKWAKSTARKKLIFSDESDRFWYAKLSEAITVEESPYHSVLALRFACDPYAYATTITTVGPQALTDNVAYTWTPSDDVTAYPIVQLQFGSGCTGGFTMTLNGDAITYPNNVSAAGYVTVSSVAYVITNVANTDTECVGTYAAANVAMTGVTGDFGKIVSGLNSLTVNTADGSGCTATVTWRRRYD